MTINNAVDINPENKKDHLNYEEKEAMMGGSNHQIS